MSFSDNYYALLEEEKKRKKKKATEQKTGHSFTDTYNELMAEADIAPTVNTTTDAPLFTQRTAPFFERGVSLPVKTTVTKGEEEKDLVFFQKGAFEDGWDKGDLWKTILGTGADAIVGLGKGVSKLVEGVVDVGSYGVAGIADAFDSEEYADKVRKKAQKNAVDDYFADVDAFYDQYSVLGKTSDAIAEALGQVGGIILTGGLGAAAGLGAAGVTALTTTTMGLSSFGSGMGEAYAGGASDKEAATYGLIKGVVDAGSELIFGGLGKTVKALGLSRGLSSLDDMFARKLSSKLTNQVAKNFVEYGVKATAEGVEEVLAGLGSAIGKKLTYMSDEELNKLVKDENLLEQFVVGTVVSGFAQGGDLNASNKSNRDFVSGLSQNEQKVVDYEVQKRTDGQKLTNKQKNSIYDAVFRDMERGRISTDTIEEVLGGDEYAAYKGEYDAFFGGDTFKAYEDAIASEEAQIKELEAQIEALENEPDTIGNRNKYNALESQIEQLRNSTARAELKAQLDSEAMRIGSIKNQLRTNVSELVKDSRLAESYRELARSYEKYTADLSKYENEHAKKTIQNIMDSGVAVNTNEFHEFADWLAQISADKGMTFSTTDAERLKGTRYDIAGKTIHGFIDENGNVTLNMDSDRAGQITVGHELTHVLEGTEFYGELQSAIKNYAISKMGLDAFNARLKETETRYKGIGDPDKELTADLIGEYIFTDTDFVRNLSVQDRNVFQKIYDEIKYLYKVATAGSKEARELEKVKRVFEQAYKESGKGQSETKYSLADSEGVELSSEQQEFFKDSKMRDENGNLKVMYHGSQDAGFHAFDAKMSDDDTSFFFVDRNDVAASYSGTTETYEAKTIRSAEDMNNFLAEIGYDQYEAVEKNGKFELLENGDHVAYSDTAQGIYDEFCWYEGVGEGDANYKVYLNLTNPLEVDVKGKNWNNISREFSQEVYDRYQSLTAEEKAALTDLAEWGEYGIFKDEMLDARAVANNSPLASAYEKLGGANANLYDAFSIAEDNFSEEALRAFAVKQMNTRDYAQKAKAEGYDGVIFKNIVDVGGYGNGSEGAATVAIAFDSSQIKSTANEKPTADKDIRYSLSDAQQEYFKDSKIRDANGNLMVVYHGTPNGNYSVFKDGTYFTDNKEYADRYQSPSASSISSGKVASNPKTFEVYLNIKKPFDIADAEARDIYINEYIKGGNALGINPYLSDAEYDKINTIDWTEGEDLREFLIDNGYDYDGLVLDEGADGGYGDEVAYRGKSYVVFSPEQVKSVDNQSPTSDPDIGFSLSDVGEEADNHGLAPINKYKYGSQTYGKDIALETAPVVKPAKSVASSQLDGDGIAPIYDAQPDKGVVDGQQSLFKEEPKLETEEGRRSTRKQLHHDIVEGIKATFKANGFDFDKVLKQAKNLGTFTTVDNMPQRVMEKALGYKEGQTLSDLTVNKVAQNETEGIKWLSSFTDRKSGLLKRISKQYRIKPGSKESAAAQMYAEGFYVDENNDIISYGDAELAKDFPDSTVQRNIKALARDPRIRQIYDDTLAAINESRSRNAYPEIPRLDNYFLHFRAMDDTFSRLGLPFNPNDIRAKDLPTDLNGVTADLKPGQPYFASAMHRTGKRTSFDLLGGLERYLSSAKNQIYHIDDIQTLRALRNYIADTYGQANGLEDLDMLSEEEAQDRIEKVYNSHLSTFAKFLNEEANILAGKTALIDRGLEGIIGRRGITFLDTVNKQVGSNMVGFNLSSSLTNFLPVAQTIAKTNKFDFTKAFAQTVANKLSGGRFDSFADDSPVIIRRKGADRFYRTPWQKLGDAGYVFMSAVDDISTELIARTKFNELTRKGMDAQKAHYETDKWVSRLMGDRSLGQMPQLYNSKMLGLVTKFQLEVRNQLDSQFYDTIQEAKVSNEHIQNRLVRNAKTAAKVTSTFVQLAVVQHLFGKAFESVAGYNPAFDIIDVLIKAFGFDDEEDSEDTVLDNIEQGFLALLEDLPYTSVFTDGGRVPISAALPIAELIKGEDEWGNEKSRWGTLNEIAPYYLMPGGYGQAKKTVKGLRMFSDDHPIAGSYTDNGGLRFPVEDTPENRIQAGIFGQWASENARDYFDGERKPLDEKKTQEFKALGISIQEYWAYQDEAKKISDRADGDSAADEDILKSKYLTSVNDELSELYAEMREIQDNPNLSDEMKRVRIKPIQNRFDELARESYQSYNKVTSDGEYATIGDRYFQWYTPENGEPEWRKLTDDQVTKYLATRNATGGYATNGTQHYRLNEGGDPDNISDWTKLSDREVERQNEVTRQLGITPEEYWSKTEKSMFPMYEGEYEYAYDNPENYAVAKAVGGYEAYKGYSGELYDIKADKDENGKSISGSRKEKVLDYINNLDADYYTKIILWKSEYPSDDSNNYEIIEYLNGRDDISFEETVAILRKLGFDVTDDGDISW